ncbi:MAG: MBOAT family protein, partial [Desulfitobacteriaceae bacterium]|nr:MBOAT family protein [Desulfitobacteriaceae bacterium]
MVFSSLIFLFAFLPLALFTYYLCPQKMKNALLFLTSLVFYAWGEPRYILIMLFSTVFDYVNGLLIQQYKERGEGRRAKAVVLSSVIINLGILGFFKYSGFVVENVNRLFSLRCSSPNIALPLGISFYTFQTLSYTIDVYRGEVEAQRNIIDFGAFVSLFPQLVAGPIVRYKTIAIQLTHRRESVDSFAYGIVRFVTGLGKKVLLANNIGQLWTQVSAISTDSLPVATAWLGAIAFSFQIYFDFSGYSDMAIGLGQMFGFR